MDKQHERLGFSDAPQWVPCPGSVYMSEKYPAVESGSGDEGTAAHWVGATALKSYQPGSERSRSCASLIDATTPEGMVVTESMTELAELLVNDVLAYCQKNGGLKDLLIEEKIMAPDIYPTDCGGTPDVGLYVPALETITVWEFKAGWRIIDTDSYQLVGQLNALLTKYPTAKYFDLRIVQPNPNHPAGKIRRWTGAINVDTDDLFTKMQNSARLALDVHPPLKSGSHCYYCSGMHSCAVGQRAAIAAMDYAGVALPNELSGMEVGHMLSMCRRGITSLRDMEIALEARAKFLNNSGEKTDGWILEPGYGRTKWSRPVKEVIAMGKMLGVNVAKEAALTPKQATKAGMPKDVVDAYSTTPMTGLKLVPEEDALKSIRQVLNNE